jgi:NTP pyrophosphatase (non-canonical NTP hydrolase)
MTWVNWQQQAVAFAEEHQLVHNPEVHTLDLISELGEVAKEWLRVTNYGRSSTTPHTTAEIHAELGDTLYSLCLLAYSCGIDLDTAFAETLHKYQTRIQQTGSPGNQPTNLKAKPRGEQEDEHAQ